MELSDRTINKASPVPLYYQLREILLEKIEEETVGSSFPTELELCERFGISRPTVRQAINELVNEGYLTRFKGKGTFIASARIRQDFLTTLESFNEEMKRKGLVPRTELLECKVSKANEHVSRMLQINRGQKVVQLRRLRYADEQPIVIVQTFLPHAAAGGIVAKDLEKESMYEILERDFGCTIGRAVRTLQATVAGEYEANLLKVKRGAPIQYIETVTYLLTGHPIEFSQAYYRGDRNTFTYELPK